MIKHRNWIKCFSLIVKANSLQWMLQTDIPANVSQAKNKQKILSHTMCHYYNTILQATWIYYFIQFGILNTKKTFKAYLKKKNIWSYEHHLPVKIKFDFLFVGYKEKIHLNFISSLNIRQLEPKLVTWNISGDINREFILMFTGYSLWISGSILCKIHGTLTNILTHEQILFAVSEQISQQSHTSLVYINNWDWFLQSTH